MNRPHAREFPYSAPQHLSIGRFLPPKAWPRRLYGATLYHTVPRASLVQAEIKAELSALRGSVTTRPSPTARAALLRGSVSEADRAGAVD